MGMCKGCGEIFGVDELRNGYCKNCINYQEEKTEICDYAKCDCGGCFIPYEKSYMIGVPFSSEKKFICNNCGKKISISSYIGNILMLFVSLFMLFVSFSAGNDLMFILLFFISMLLFSSQEIYKRIKYGL